MTNKKLESIAHILNKKLFSNKCPMKYIRFNFSSIKTSWNEAAVCIETRTSKYYGAPYKATDYHICLDESIQKKPIAIVLILIHEMSHTIHNNHGPKFKSLICQIAKKLEIKSKYLFMYRSIITNDIFMRSDLKYRLRNVLGNIV